MNDAPRQKLREIIRQHGQVIIENPRRLENLLRDYCGEFRREISVLTMALEEHAVADMLSAAPAALPRKVTLARLAQRLCDNLAAKFHLQRNLILRPQTFLPQSHQQGFLINGF